LFIKTIPHSSKERQSSSNCKDLANPKKKKKQKKTVKLGLADAGKNMSAISESKI